MKYAISLQKVQRYMLELYLLSQEPHTGKDLCSKLKINNVGFIDLSDLLEQGYINYIQSNTTHHAKQFFITAQGEQVLKKYVQQWITYEVEVDDILQNIRDRRPGKTRRTVFSTRWQSTLVNKLITLQYLKYGPVFGCGLNKYIHDYSPSAIAPFDGPHVIQLLKADGYVTLHTLDNQYHRKYWEITDTGLQQLANLKQKWYEEVSQIKSIMKYEEFA